MTTNRAPGYFECYGVHFALHAHDAELLARHQQALPFRTRPCPEPAQTSFECFLKRESDGHLSGKILGSPTPERWESWRASEISRFLSQAQDSLEFSVACHARDYVFVHAAACSFAGRGIVLPGRSLTGKTTLLMSLMELGAHYYSDEFAVLDPSGRLHPFARDLSVRPRGDSGVGRRVNAGTLGYAVGEDSVPIDLVARLAFRADQSSSISPVSSGLGTLALFDNAVAARRLQMTAMNTLASASRGARCFQGNRGEAREAAEWILGTVTL